jgi:hypothetical protein
MSLDITTLEKRPWEAACKIRGIVGTAKQGHHGTSPAHHQTGGRFCLPRGEGS